MNTALQKLTLPLDFVSHGWPNGALWSFGWA